MPLEILRMMVHISYNWNSIEAYSDCSEKILSVLRRHDIPNLHVIVPKSAHYQMGLGRESSGR